MNEETVVAFCLFSIFVAIAKYGGPMYKEWAEGQVNKIRDILNSARADHTQAVKDRIESVSQMSGVVDVTKSLFEVSKVRWHHLECSLWRDLSYIAGNCQVGGEGL